MLGNFESHKDVHKILKEIPQIICHNHADEKRKCTHLKRNIISLDTHVCAHTHAKAKSNTI